MEFLVKQHMKHLHKYMFFVYFVLKIWRWIAERTTSHILPWHSQSTPVIILWSWTGSKMHQLPSITVSMMLRDCFVQVLQTIARHCKASTAHGLSWSNLSDELETSCNLFFQDRRQCRSSCCAISSGFRLPTLRAMCWKKDGTWLPTSFCESVVSRMPGVVTGVASEIQKASFFPDKAALRGVSQSHYELQQPWMRTAPFF